MRDVVVSYLYDEKDVMSVSYMYGWIMDCTIGNKPSILLLLQLMTLLHWLLVILKPIIGTLISLYSTSYASILCIQI